MPYMIYQQYKAAVTDGYMDRPADEVRRHIGQATACRRWLESVEIDPDVRDALVEQFHAIEEAFEEILRDPHRTPT